MLLLETEGVGEGRDGVWGLDGLALHAILLSASWNVAV